MGDIRFLGRARGGRCVYCHDSLRGEVQTCPECSATWHPDCGDTSRCPTLGCSGPAPGAVTRPGRPRRGRTPAPPERTRSRPPSSFGGAPESLHIGGREPLDPSRPRPGVVARLGPYLHLLLSASMNLVAAGSAFGLLGWIALHQAAFLKWVTTGENGQPSGLLAQALSFVLIIGLPLAIAFITCRWLARIPGVLREVSFLLSDTRPTAMRLTVEAHDGDESTTWIATLAGGGTTLTIDIGSLVSPFWLKRRQTYEDEPVLVYGLPPPGPYVLEFSDGALALVHPD